MARRSNCISELAIHQCSGEFHSTHHKVCSVCTEGFWMVSDSLVLSDMQTNDSKFSKIRWFVVIQFCFRTPPTPQIVFYQSGVGTDSFAGLGVLDGEVFYFSMLLVKLKGELWPGAVGATLGMFARQFTRSTPYLKSKWFSSADKVQDAYGFLAQCVAQNLLLFEFHIRI